MQPTNILLFGFLAYIGVKALAKSRAAEQLDFFVQKVAVRFSGITPILDIIIGIQNPTNETLRIGSIIGQVYVNGEYAANISGHKLTDIKGGTVSYFPISARLSIYGVVSQVIDLVNAIKTGGVNGGINAIKNQNIRFKGIVNSEGIALPLDFNYKVL